MKKDPYEGINFIKTKAEIKNKEGKVIFSEEVEFPDYFSNTSINIVSNKYLHNSAKRKETSLKQMIDRVSDTIAQWGKEDGYFRTDEEYEDFLYNLKYYQIHQYFAFNSPVYFNVGIQKHPSMAACYILKIEDTMDSITEIGKIESKIFKNGSGSGINYSPLRASCERVNEKGCASGPVSFLKVHDTNAGVIKSGGTLRRAAKLACLNIDHPDIEKFIECKEIEEEKLRILSKEGVKPYSGYEMSDHVFFQNTNLSVGITNDFMKAIKEDREWDLLKVIKKTDQDNLYKTVKAKDLFNKIVEGAWKVGCPGMLFLDNLNDWNTCKNSGSINSTNPCGEYAWFDNSSCNLASINFLKFFSRLSKDNNNFMFAYDTFKEVIKTMITAQDILIDRSSYPTEEIAKNSKEYRPLGLGYSNLHATLMYLGIPYDSTEGRDLAAALTSLMTSEAYKVSEKLAEKKGSFKHFQENKSDMINVFLKHFRSQYDKLYKYYGIDEDKPFTEIEEIIYEIINNSYSNWNSFIDTYLHKGIRNAQVTLLAPTGTISFLMGCDTFGIQPEFSLVKYKNLVSTEQGSMALENTTIRKALRNLGYKDYKIKKILSNLDKLEEVLEPPHLPIFDTEMRNGTRKLDHMALVKMMASVQPFLSGAISSTVNVPNDSTTKDIEDIFMKAWEWGLKGITVYRDGSKHNQPLVTKKKEEQNIIKWITQEDGRIWDGLKGDGVPPPKTGEFKPISNGNFKCEDIIKHQKNINNCIQKEKDNMGFNIDGLSGNQLKEEYTVTTEMKKERLPETRKGINHKFVIGGFKGYINTGEYEDGRLGEVFLSVSKQGSTLSGLLDSLAIAVSVSLQYRVPLKDIVRKMMNMRFEPAGITRNQDIRFAKSIVDYIFRFLGMRYLLKEDQIELGFCVKEEKKEVETSRKKKYWNVPSTWDLNKKQPDENAIARLRKHGINIIEESEKEIITKENREIVKEDEEDVVRAIEPDNPFCNVCGAIMTRTGSCYTCTSCGTTSGSCG